MRIIRVFSKALRYWLALRIVDDNFRFTDYDNVKNNEYFITSEEADKKIREFKKEVLSKYPC